ncbi:MAG: hypothetical protein HY667_04505 [Chloroflexi bacterium]|nr:hypothetical protein [Chloroflexota bacterium]
MPKRKGHRKRFAHGPPKRVIQVPAGGEPEVAAAESVATAVRPAPPPTPIRAAAPHAKTTPRPMINVGAELARILIVTAIIAALLAIAILVFR